MRGFFIALEGSDGSGKTTVLKGIKARFAQKEIPVLYTREPGGTPIAEKIRAILLDPAHQEMAPMTEALLYAASRAQHVREVILPALEEGKILLSDRFVLSSLVYQGIARGVGLEVDPLTVLRRKAGRVEQDRLEKAGDAFFQNVYNGYQQALRTMENVVVVDASQPAEVVISSAWQAIEDALSTGRNQ